MSDREIREKPDAIDATLEMLEVIELENTLYSLMKNDTPVANMNTRLTSILKRTSIYKPLLPETNRDSIVKYFFTRPRCNLSRSNIIMDRVLAKLLKSKGNSIEKYVRVLLDPFLGYKFNKEYVDSELNLVDEPFMPILNNTINTASGHPDPIIDTFTSKEGVMKEQVTHYDGTDKIFNSWDMTVTFNNVVGEGVWLLIDTWVRYGTLVKSALMPYTRYLLGRQIDYQSCLYTIVLDTDGRSIKHTASTMLFPTATTKGSIFDTAKGTSKRSGDGDVMVRFKCLGAEYDDPITSFEFNKHVATFAPSLRGYLDGDITGSDYIVVPPNIYKRFSTKCIPFIDLYAGKLEWLVLKDEVVNLKEDYLKILKTLGDKTNG